MPEALGPVELAVRSFIQNDFVADALLGQLKGEWLAEYKASRNDGHIHSFDRHAQDFDYCQVNGCQTTYAEYLGEL